MTMKNSTSLSILILSIIILNLTACTPVPFTRHKSPSINGVIHSDNIPARGIELYLSIKGDDRYCSKFIAKTTTNDRGEFSIPSIKEKIDYTPLMTHYLDEWSLCVDTSGVRQVIYSNNRYGKGSVIASVNLNCDLKEIGRKASPCNNPLLKD
jgi:hypothetical protein